VQYRRGLLIFDPDEVRIVFLALFTFFEPIRLAAGYYGNLKERVWAET
jgi:hypothetical protein